MKKETIGEMLQRLRKAKGWKQQDFANASGVDVRAIQKYEADEREPQLRVAIKLAKALGIDANDYEHTRIVPKKNGKPVKKSRPRGRPRRPQE